MGGDRVGPAVWLLAACALGVAALASAPPSAAADPVSPSISDMQPAEGAFANASALGPSGLARVFVHALIADNGPLDPLNATARVLEATDGRVAAELEVELAPSQPGVLEVGRLVGLADGTYRLVVEAVDGAGNTARAERNFTVDTKAPRLTVSAPALSKESVAWVLIDARDEGAGIVLSLIHI